MPKIYPLAGLYPYIPAADLKRLGGDKTKLRAVYTGEYRCPRKGEWFLSGSTVEAYHTTNNLASAYHIAKLVQVRERVVIEIVN